MSTHSDFWIGDNSIDWDFSEESQQIDISNAKSEKTANLIRLNAARRAIANYVSILTNKNLPVLFNNNNASLTDGKIVYIGSDVDDKKNFDVAVGLALHEASHIVYSDFDLFKTIWQNVPREIYDITEKLNISKDIVAKTCHQILNIVEDRYIDYLIYTNAPGYRGYYQSLYKKYFHSSSIDDGLKSELYRTLSIESYLYRLINITNKHTDLKALPGLYEIAKILNLTNISRLKTPNDRLQIAIEIAKIVFGNIENGNSLKSQLTEVTGDNSDSSSEEMFSNSNESDDSKDDLNKLFGGEETMVSTIDDENEKKISDIGEDKDISQTKINKIKNAFEKQKKFIDGDLKKKKVTVKDNKVLDVLEQSKIELIDVGSDYVADNGYVGAAECILVKNMTRELMMSDQFPLTPSYELKGYGTEHFEIPDYVKRHQNFVNEGISLGIKIGKRLQFRNEVNVDKFSRRENGKIDKRLLHELGFDEENVFYTNTTHKYKKMHFHISVDASSSMASGGYNDDDCKWSKTIRLVTAIAKAASILENIRVTISFRTTLENMPYVVIAYDSNVDKFSKIKNLFAFLQPNGNTPEGLCYEAILKTFSKIDNQTESYFINFSDGEPCFTFNNLQLNTGVLYYNGEKAANHTKKQVSKIRKNGYNVISYFITYGQNSYNDRSSVLFRTMYGSDANFIDVKSLNQIVKTLNGKLLNSVDN